MSHSQEQTDLHNRLFQEAWNLSETEVQLDGPALKKPGFFARRRLRKSKILLIRVLEIHPANWSAMLMLGKIEQRFENHGKALNGC